VLEFIDPDYLRRLVESMGRVVESLSHLSTTLQNISRGGFDFEGEIRSRIMWINDGYVRVMVHHDSAVNIDLVSVLRELSWAINSQLEAKSLLRESVGFDGAPPPPGGVVLLGFDGEYLRRVRVAPDGKLLAQLG